MRQLRLKLIGLTLSCLFTATSAEEIGGPNETVYRATLFGSAATGDQTPFWMASNRYGVVPLEAGNGYLRAAVFHRQAFGKGFSWGAGLDGVAVMPRRRNVYVQQLYGELGYKCLLLRIGSKERAALSDLDRNLSTGDVIQSWNARPIPEVNLSIPEFTVIPGLKGWVQFKGDFAIGRSFDKDYLEHFAAANQTYINQVLWHHKSLFVRIRDTRGDFPLSATLGLEHVAQWGGTSTDPEIGKQPQSLKDFIRVMAGRGGGSDATLSDQINVLGNHQIAYHFELAYTTDSWLLRGYHQHIAADKSGVEFSNGTDGLWGLQLDLPHFTWLNRVLFEHFTTMNQSGPFHYIDFDHDKHPGRGGGGDNYYNNGEYRTGHSYFNRGIGSPLVPSPEYNRDGTLGFKSTRVKDWHFGAEGHLSRQVAYRVLLTFMDSRGTPYAPFLKKKTGVSGLLDITYTHPKLAGWTFVGSLAADKGEVLREKSVGFSLGVSKRGVLKRWF